MESLLSARSSVALPLAMLAVSVTVVVAISNKREQYAHSPRLQIQRQDLEASGCTEYVKAVQDRGGQRLYQMRSHVR
jgi:hypothetical protein